MKSIKKVAQENPKSTTAGIIAAVIGVATLFIDKADILGIGTDIVGWVSFGISALTLLMTYVNANTKA